MIRAELTGFTYIEQRQFGVIADHGFKRRGVY
jgi:hypothetical protein